MLHILKINVSFNFLNLNQNDDHVDNRNLGDIDKNKEKNLINFDVEDEMAEIKNANINIEFSVL